MKNIKEKILINDKRLTPDMKRIRSGSTQLFWHKGLNNSKKAEIVLEPPRRELYAELIDGKWYWVNGCCECNGELRNSIKSYIECEKHDVCEICRRPRKMFKSYVYGTKRGWICGSCKQQKDEERKRIALEAMTSKEYNKWDYLYQDNIICPHCATKQKYDNTDIPEGDQVCDTCGGKYSVEPHYSIKFSTACIGKRITA